MGVTVDLEPMEALLEEAVRRRAKRDAFVSMLDVGMAMLHLDARASGVDVPLRFRKDRHLRLNFSYRFGLSTFMIEDDAVTADLSFQGLTYLCVIPWDAVFGMTSHVSGETRVWPEDMPAEMLIEAAALAEAAKAKPSPPDEPDEEVGGAVRRVGHLRVVK